MKKYLRFLLVAVLCLQLSISCTTYYGEPCDEAIIDFREDYCNMVLNVLDYDSFNNKTNYAGISIDTGKETRFKSNNANYLDTRQYFEIGDTLMKNKGLSKFLLLKKDSVIIFNFFCEDNLTQIELLSYTRPLSESDSQTMKEYAKDSKSLFSK